MSGKVLSLMRWYRENKVTHLNRTYYKCEAKIPITTYRLLIYVTFGFSRIYTFHLHLPLI